MRPTCAWQDLMRSPATLLHSFSNETNGRSGLLLVRLGRDGYRRRGRIELARGPSLFSRSKARVLRAAKRGMEIDPRRWSVNADHARLEPADDAHRSIEVTRMDGGNEAVSRRVSKHKRLLNIVGSEEADNR